MLSQDLEQKGEPGQGTHPFASPLARDGHKTIVSNGPCLLATASMHHGPKKTTEALCLSECSIAREGVQQKEKGPVLGQR